MRTKLNKTDNLLLQRTNIKFHPKYYRVKKALTFSLFIYFVQKNVLKENQFCFIPFHPQIGEKYTFQCPRLECTDAQENIQKSLQSSCEIQVNGT